MSERIPRVGIGVFVFRDGKFLMGQRRGSHGEGSWSIPGGHLEFNETPEVTAIREVKEETGCDIHNIRFAAVTNDLFINEDKHYVTLWMMSDWKAKEPKVTEPDKFIKQGWFDFSTLPSPLFLPWAQLKTSQFYENLQIELAKTEK